MAEPTPQPPGEMGGWPTLRFIYRTDEQAIADLLPPGITPGSDPHVHIHVYQVPIGGEPEFGVVIMVPADFEGEEGFYQLGTGIDQEQAIFISQELNGQPKFPCAIKYFRIGNHVVARCFHQGYTFLEFGGDIGDDITERVRPSGPRTSGGSSRCAYRWCGEGVRLPAPRREGRVTLVAGVPLRGRRGARAARQPVDPIAERLPLREQVAVHLQKTQMDYAARSLTLAGPLDPLAFWSHADTIGGSRWPGMWAGRSAGSDAGRVLGVGGLGSALLARQLDCGLEVTVFDP